MKRELPNKLTVKREMSFSELRGKTPIFNSEERKYSNLRVKIKKMYIYESVHEPVFLTVQCTKRF